MKKITISLITIFIAQVCQSQTLDFEWVKSMGSTTTDQGNSIFVDRGRNVYTTGLYTDQVDFDPGSGKTVLKSNGGTDIFISKLNHKGELLWAKSIGSAKNDAGNGIAVDTFGNVYVTGYFTDKADFDPGSGTLQLNSAGGTDIFVCKFDASGNLIFAKQMGGTSDDAANAIRLDLGGAAYTTGFFAGTADFDPGKNTANLSSNGLKDIFISKLDKSGNYVWGKQMGGKSDDIGKSIFVNSSNYVNLTGYYYGTCDFDPGTGSVNLSSNGDADAFVAMLDSKGNYTWAKSFGGTSYDAGNSVTSDANGNAIVTGSFIGYVELSTKPAINITSIGGSDAFILKMEGSGVYTWIKQAGGSKNESGNSIITDSDNAIYSTGSFQDVCDFDPSSSSNDITSEGSNDVYIWKLNTSGNFDWAYGMGGGSEDIGLGIALSSVKNVYTTGFYKDKVDFDPGANTTQEVSNGDEDIFVHKMSECVESVTSLTVQTCNTAYKFNNSTYYQSGIYYQMLKNAVSCDSLIEFKLIMNSPTFRTIKDGICDKYTLNGVTYTTPGTYSQQLKNSVGCDSFLVLELETLATDDTLIDETCNSSYVLNAQTYTKSGTYVQNLTNKVGCDSTLTLIVNFKKPTSQTIIAANCYSYVLNGTTYTNSGQYVQNLKNVAGCDSTLNLDLTIYNSTSRTLNVEACSTYVLNAQTYNQSGTYQQKLKNKNGCDSSITLNLTMTNSSSTLTQAACYKYQLGSVVYTKSGTYNQIIPNAKGCDSAITLNLTINTVDNAITQTGNTLTANANTATYQWLDCNKGYAPISGQTFKSYTPTTTGNYAVAVTQNSCSDTSDCVSVKIGSVKNVGNYFYVYPNPMQHEMQIVMKNSLRNADIKIIGITGQVVLEKSNLSGNQFRIDVSDLAPGVFIVQISENGMDTRMRIIKE
jgi:hypothetical protein